MAKKSQTATEYLIILAVVIIIALIVVGVMGGIPGIKQDPALNFSRNFCLSRGYLEYSNVTIYKQIIVPDEGNFLKITCLNISDGVVLHEDTYKVVYP
jgi:hypothetical protein